MVRGNQSINKSLAKDVENGHIVQELPKVEFEGRMCSLFTPISPTYCIICRSPLKRNEYYDRFAISSYGIIPPIGYVQIQRACPTIQNLEKNKANSAFISKNKQEIYC